jgi:hypothetical protein
VRQAKPMSERRIKIEQFRPDLGDAPNKAWKPIPTSTRTSPIVSLSLSNATTSNTGRTGPTTTA